MKEKRIFVIEKDIIYDSETKQIVGTIQEGKMKLDDDLPCGHYYIKESTNYNPIVCGLFILGYVLLVLLFIFFMQFVLK